MPTSFLFAKVVIYLTCETAEGTVVKARGAF